jgi:hypothetical protein
MHSLTLVPIIVMQMHGPKIDAVLSDFDMENFGEVLSRLHNSKDRRLLVWILLSWCYEFHRNPIFQDASWRREFSLLFLYSERTEEGDFKMIKSLTGKTVWKDLVALKEDMVSFVLKRLERADQGDVGHLIDLKFLHFGSNTDQLRLLLLNLTQRCVEYPEWHADSRDESCYKSRRQADRFACRRAHLVQLWLREQQEVLGSPAFLELVVDEIRLPYGRLDLAIRLFYEHIHNQEGKDLVSETLTNSCIEGLSVKMQLFISRRLVQWCEDETTSGRTAPPAKFSEQVTSFVQSYWETSPALCNAIISGIRDLAARGIDLSMLRREGGWYDLVHLAGEMCSLFKSEPHEYPEHFHQCQSAQEIGEGELHHFLAYNFRRLRFLLFSMVCGDISHPPIFYEIGLEAPNRGDIAAVETAFEEILFCLYFWKDLEDEFEIFLDLEYALYTFATRLERGEQTKTVAGLFLLLLSAATSTSRASEREHFEQRMNDWNTRINRVVDSATLRRFVIQYKEKHPEKDSPFTYPGGPYDR